MKQIELIRSGNIDELTKAINDFCLFHKVIDIKLQTLQVVNTYNKDGIPINTTILDTAMIIYER